MPMLLLTIFAGGALGAVARYGLSTWIYTRIGTTFPWGTLSVNMLGSFVLGLLLPLLETEVPITNLRGFLTAGFLSAFTTFSTFAYEATRLTRDGEPGRAAVYVGASVLFGLVSIAGGLTLAQLLL